MPQVALALEERDVFRFSQEQAGGVFCIIQLKFRKKIFCLSDFDILIYNFMFVAYKIMDTTHNFNQDKEEMIKQRKGTPLKG